MHDEIPVPPACPTWCQTASPGWEVDLGIASQLCQCALPAGTDTDGQPVTVTLRRYASFDPDSGLDVQDAHVRVEVVGDLSRLTALNLAHRLVDAVGLLTGAQSAA